MDCCQLLWVLGTSFFLLVNFGSGSGYWDASFAPSLGMPVESIVKPLGLLVLIWSHIGIPLAKKKKKKGFNTARNIYC